MGFYTEIPTHFFETKKISYEAMEFPTPEGPRRRPAPTVGRDEPKRGARRRRRRSVGWLVVCSENMPIVAEDHEGEKMRTLRSKDFFNKKSRHLRLPRPFPFQKKRPGHLQELLAFCGSGNFGRARLEESEGVGTKAGGARGAENSGGSFGRKKPIYIHEASFVFFLFYETTYFVSICTRRNNFFYSIKTTTCAQPLPCLGTTQPSNPADNVSVLGRRIKSTSNGPKTGNESTAFKHRRQGLSKS